MPAGLAAAGVAARDRALDAWDWIVERAGALRASVAGGGGSLRDRIPTLDGLPLPELPEIPRSRLWAWASVPLAILGVIAGLALLRGGDDSALQPEIVESPAVADAEASEFIEEPGFTIALPSGWKRSNPPNGASFSAKADGGLADATLWIERAPDLSFKEFERRSLRRLSELSSTAAVSDRVEGPTLESSITQLRAEVPVGDGSEAIYRVTLRGAGDFRQYFVTVTQPGARPGLLADVELLHNSLRPEVELKGVDG